MTATKGPIERIKEVTDTVYNETSNTRIRDAMESIEAACDELVAHQRHPQVLMLTTDEHKAVWDAITEALRIIGNSKTDGAALEKIATEWMASKHARQSQPDRIDNGDGTVTFNGVPVNVPAAIVADGSTVLAVRSPKQGERYVHHTRGSLEVCSIAGGPVHARIILSSPPVPQFREGGYYRTRGGEVKGPIRRVETSESEYVLIDDHTGAKYTERGCRIGISSTDDDLRPGEVTVWAKPPVSLKAGEYVWGVGEWLHWDCGGHRKTLGKEWCVSIFYDWINPPKIGRYTVPGGGKPATWEGDA